MFGTGFAVSNRIWISPSGVFWTNRPHIQPTSLTAFPAKAGTHSSTARRAEERIPAFAGNAIQLLLSPRGQGVALVPVGGGLVGPADPERRRLIVGAADNLQRQWQPGRGETVGHRERAQLQQVDESGEMRRRRRLVDRVDADRRGLRR